MAAVQHIGLGKTAPAMATPWRRRRMCLLVADVAVPAALREISGKGAFVETNARPALQSKVSFHHPDAGAIDAIVSGLCDDGVRISFAADSTAMAFALTAITADMTQS